MDADERLARVELAVVYIRAAARQERRRCVEVAEAAVVEYESIMSSLRNSEEWGFAMNELSEESCKKIWPSIGVLEGNTGKNQENEMRYRYFALPKEYAVSGTGEIRRGAEDGFFAVVKQVSGYERSVAEPLLHSGRRIETCDFTIWAEPINPFKPAKIL